MRIDSPRIVRLRRGGSCDDAVVSAHGGDDRRRSITHRRLPRRHGLLIVVSVVLDMGEPIETNLLTATTAASSGRGEGGSDQGRKEWENQ